MSDESNWMKGLEAARNALQILDENIGYLTKYRDETTAEIAQYLRVDKGIELDVDAIRATLTRPYTIIPINEHEAWLIHWRGIKMPIFGWVVSQEPAFIKAKVTRSMDLLTPFPAWMKDELGWKPPAHQAIIDGTHTNISLTEGDETTFKRRYGQFIGGKQEDGTFKIKGGDAWIKLVAALVRDGILPYASTPVAKEHWNPNAKSTIVLKDYQIPVADEFLRTGAVLANLPPGAGKTFITLYILQHFIGRVLILADTTILIDQWRDRIRTYAPNADVTLSTYQGASKYLKEEWDLLVPDEAQRLPANTFSKLAFIKTRYRFGLTGTPWREDERQFLITALSGKPVSIRWSELIASGILRRPRIIIATVSNETEKTKYVKSLLSKRKGRVLIFCDWIEQGQELADALDVPFIHGGTTRKLEKVQENDVCVVSRIGDRGLDLPDLRMVIEVAGAGSAREQFAQRVGRLLHGQFAGEFITVFTPEEAAKYRGRIFGVESELAGEVDIEFIAVGNVAEKEKLKVPKVRSAKSMRRSTLSVTRSVSAQLEENPADEIASLLSLPAINAKITEAKKSVGETTAAFIERVIRYCWDTALSASDIAEGLGIANKGNRSRLNSACKAAAAMGLLIVDADGRYRVNQDEFNRLKVLSGLRKRG